MPFMAFYPLTAMHNNGILVELSQNILENVID